MLNNIEVRLRNELRQIGLLPDGQPWRAPQQSKAPFGNSQKFGHLFSMEDLLLAD